MHPFTLRSFFLPQAGERSSVAGQHRSPAPPVRFVHELVALISVCFSCVRKVLFCFVSALFVFVHSLCIPYCYDLVSLCCLSHSVLLGPQAFAGLSPQAFGLVDSVISQLVVVQTVRVSTSCCRFCTALRHLTSEPSSFRWYKPSSCRVRVVFCGCQ